IDQLAAVLAAHGLQSFTRRRLLSPPRRALALFPRAFQRSPDTVPILCDYVGPAYAKRQLSKDWPRTRDGRPVLLISLGTLYDNDLPFFRMCIEALGDTRWHVIMKIGRRVDTAALGALPRHFEVHYSVPQFDILAGADLFIGHGGMAGVMEATVHSVPIVAIPQVAEQRVTAEQVALNKIGVHLPRQLVTASSLRDAVLRAASDPDIVHGIAVMQRHIQRSGGAPAAADLIEKLLPHGWPPGNRPPPLPVCSRSGDPLPIVPKVTSGMEE
ncbi:glycosyltransferase, MGT family, partial [Actinobacteria bacterium OV450]